MGAGKKPAGARRSKVGWRGVTRLAAILPRETSSAGVMRSAYHPTRTRHRSCAAQSKPKLPRLAAFQRAICRRTPNRSLLASTHRRSIACNSLQGYGFQRARAQPAFPFSARDPQHLAVRFSVRFQPLLRGEQGLQTRAVSGCVVRARVEQAIGQRIQPPAAAMPATSAIPSSSSLSSQCVE